jgi:tRNA A37 threonylcarbamoyladenosine dehydratase
MTENIFSRLHLLVGDDALKAFEKTKVIIFGIGGVGSWCAEALVRSAVKNITIVDSDYICETNINRQLPATTKTVGKIKADVLKERLLEINPAANIKSIHKFYTAENSSEFELSDYDYVIDAIDSVKEKAHLINTVTRLNNTKLFSSMGAALKMDIFKIKKSEFWKIKGDPLARALRNNFKRSKIFPEKKFQCIWSDEARKNVVESNLRINGTITHTTATFGFALANLLIDDIIK